MFSIQPVERIIQIDALISVYDYVRPKGFYFPGESHDFWECVYIHEGEVTATADDRVYQLGSGKLLLHKPMEFHRIWAKEDCAPHVINISFRAKGSLTEQLACRCFDLRYPQQEELLRIAGLFSNLETAKDKCSVINLIATRLEAFLIELSEIKEDSAPSRSPVDSQYSKIVQTMQNHCIDNLSLKELAKLCQMSVSNMKRIFGKYSDVGIAKFYSTLRIRYAKELLEQGMPGNKVAQMLHFSDTAYFYTVFKRETGLTPAQYRKQQQAYLLPY